MSTFTVNYYNPNNTNYVGILTDITTIVDNTKTPNVSCNTRNLSTDCNNVRTAIATNTDYATQLQTMNNKNATALGLYNDSGIFYTTQYLQLWNMAGGIALSGFLIYYLIKNQK